ncbi:hypothetical protein Tco_0776321 [Tanacetum coccineum]
MLRLLHRVNLMETIGKRYEQWNDLGMKTEMSLTLISRAKASHIEEFSHPILAAQSQIRSKFYPTWSLLGMEIKHATEVMISRWLFAQWREFEMTNAGFTV